MASQRTLLVILAMGWAFAVTAPDSAAPPDSPLRTRHRDLSAGDRTEGTFPESGDGSRCGLEVPRYERAPIDEDPSLSDQRPQFTLLADSGLLIGCDPGSADASIRFALAPVLAAEKPRSHAIRAP